MNESKNKAAQEVSVQEQKKYFHRLTITSENKIMLDDFSLTGVTEYTLHKDEREGISELTLKLIIDNSNSIS